VFYLKDELYKNYKYKYCYPEGSECKFAESIPFDAPIVSLLSNCKRPLLEEELQHFQYLHKTNLNYSLIVPCFVEDELLGIMMLGSKPGKQMYTPDDMLVFETLSYSTALAIENCYFWKEIEDRQRKARLEEMDAYSYSLAHEIDNPMYIIIGQTETLQKILREGLDLPAEKQKELEGSINFILDSAWRVSAMVKAIRDFGQPVTGEFKPLRITDVIESFSQLYFPRLKSTGITFIKEIPEGLGFVRGEKPQLMQILVILANNSLHAMQRAKEKKIILKAEGVNHEWVRISFRDTGYGIKKEDLGIIFQSFVTTKASSEGSGMGLYNAKKIIERHKGVIWAESEGEGKGAVFFIDLPQATDIKPEELDGIDNGINLLKNEDTLR
jgi:signal transduction histidine kinase